MKTRHLPTISELRGGRPLRPRHAPSVRENEGSKTVISMTIHRSPAELFAFWRNFENLPRVMEHVESVECIDDTRSHWRVRRWEDKFVEWEAMVINERPNEMIAWQSLEGSDVRHAGSIWFTPAPGDLGTEVKLAVEYRAGGWAEAMARFLRRSPAQQMREDLRHFKQWMETGEIPTTSGQPAGRDEDKAEKYEEAK